jgi:WD40 repeat protein
MSEPQNDLSIRHVIFGVLFCVILVMLLMSGGCGFRYQAVYSLAFSPDGLWLAAGMQNSRDARVPGKGYHENVCQTVELINVNNLQDRKIVAQEIHYGFQGTSSHRIPQVVFGPTPNTLTIHLWLDEPLKIFDMDSNSLQDTTQEYLKEVWTFAYSPDGTMVATGEGSSFVTLREVSTGREIRTFPKGFQSYFRASPMPFSPDGNMLYLYSSEEGPSVWDTQTEELLFQIPCERESKFRDVVFFPDSERLAVADESGIYIWKIAEIKNGQALQENVRFPDSSGTDNLVLSPNGKTLVAAKYDGLKLFETATGKQTAAYSWDAIVCSVAFSPDGNTLATGDRDGNVILWDVHTHEKLSTIRIRGISRMNSMIPISLLIALCLLYRWLPSKKPASADGGAVSPVQTKQKLRWADYGYISLVILAYLYYAIIFGLSYGNSDLPPFLRHIPFELSFLGSAALFLVGRRSRWRQQDVTFHPAFVWSNRASGILFGSFVFFLTWAVLY